MTKAPSSGRHWYCTQSPQLLCCVCQGDRRVSDSRLRPESFTSGSTGRCDGVGCRVELGSDAPVEVRSLENLEKVSKGQQRSASNTQRVFSGEQCDTVGTRRPC